MKRKRKKKKKTEETWRVNAGGSNELSDILLDFVQRYASYTVIIRLNYNILADREWRYTKDLVGIPRSEEVEAASSPTVIRVWKRCCSHHHVQRTHGLQVNYNLIA